MANCDKEWLRQPRCLNPQKCTQQLFNAQFSTMLLKLRVAYVSYLLHPNASLRANAVTPFLIDSSVVFAECHWFHIDFFNCFKVVNSTLPFYRCFSIYKYI